MIGKDLIAVLRNDLLDDIRLPYLWTDPELLRNLNYAEVQACRRANLIIDSSTANDSGTSGTYGTAGQRPLCQLTILAGVATYTLSSKVLQIRRCQLDSMNYPLTGPVTYEDLDDLMSGWMGTAGSICVTNTGDKATGSVISNSTDLVPTNVSNGDLLTIDTKTYTFVTGTPSNEGDVKIGITIANTLDNLKLAVNRTDPTTNNGVNYQVAAVHPTVSATTNTNTVQTFEALLAGVAGNSIALAENAVTLSVSNSLLSGGTDPSGTPYCFLNEPGNTISFISAPAANDTAYLVISRLPLLPFTLQTSPEIAESYHEGLLDWAAHRAYMKNDSETFNLDKARIHEAKFTQQFGSLPDAYSERMRKTLSMHGRMRSRGFGD